MRLTEWRAHLLIPASLSITEGHLNSIDRITPVGAKLHRIATSARRYLAVLFAGESAVLRSVRIAPLVLIHPGFVRISWKTGGVWRVRIYPGADFLPPSGFINVRVTPHLTSIVLTAWGSAQCVQRRIPILTVRAPQEYPQPQITATRLSMCSTPPTMQSRLLKLRRAPIFNPTTHSMNAAASDESLQLKASV